MASLCFSHWAAINSKTSIHRSRKTEEYRPIALCVVCAIPHRAQPMIYYAGVVTSETCFVKWHQHITSNWVNRAHWPTKENKQAPICFCILGTWKLAWNGLKRHRDVFLLIQNWQVPGFSDFQIQGCFLFFREMVPGLSRMLLYYI